MKPPIPVMIVIVVYLLVGVMGFVYHFSELTAGHRDAIAIELTELTAVVAGVGLLLRQNWARWLALAWVIFPRGDQHLPSAQGAADPCGALHCDRMAVVPARDCAAGSKRLQS